MSEFKCLRCQGEMERGFLLERESVAPTPLNWVEDGPEYRFLSLKTAGKRTYEVIAYRCLACGYLELYAPK